jgi:hypothetical protein
VVGARPDGDELDEFPEGKEFSIALHRHLEALLHRDRMCKPISVRQYAFKSRSRMIKRF